MALYNEQQITLNRQYLMHYLYDDMCSDNLPESGAVRSMVYIT